MDQESYSCERGFGVDRLTWTGMTVMVSKMAHQPTPTSMNETIMDMSDGSGIKTPYTLTLGHDERRPFAKVLSESTN